jgi:2-polyprenyl-6-hydroxyphenyl methylase/3-demethylubiquinone-9 3-methyltransferase
MSIHSIEVAQGERFEFGENWRRFLDVLDDTRISRAQDSLKKMLGVEELAGKRFLDIGAGSGLFSLAARFLGAQVHSCDYDPTSVACVAELKRRYFPDDAHWRIEEGSALDADYLHSLGTFDVVYAWGVLHHTGHMWQGLENVHRSVAPGGKLLISIYNDTGTQSARWRLLKRVYNKLPRPLKAPYVLVVSAPREMKQILRSLLGLQLSSYFRLWTQYDPDRGMNRWHDLVDWVGGYPYETAKPEEIFDFYQERGFTLTKLKCGGVGLGCNEFVFLKSAGD